MLHSMARRIGARITEVPASHALFMTQAKAVADVIDEAARVAASGPPRPPATMRADAKNPSISPPRSEKHHEHQHQ